MDGVLVDVGSSWKFVHREFGTDNEDNLRKYVDGEIDYFELNEEYTCLEHNSTNDN